jgi:elongator complex protein 2
MKMYTFMDPVSDKFSSLAHVDQIHQMAWRPSATDPHELATCSDDGTLRILRVQLNSE